MYIFFADLLKKMPSFRDCYRLVVQVLTLLVKFPPLWIWNNLKNQTVLRAADHSEPEEHEDHEGKFKSLLSFDRFGLVAF